MKDLKKWAPWLVLAALAIYELTQSSSGDSSDDDGAQPLNTAVLGSRTMSVMQDFVDKLLPIAQQVESETGISALLGVGESSEESGWGSSLLSRSDAKLQILPAGTVGPANNLFGFTAELGTYWRSQNKPYVLMTTHEWVAKDKMPAGAKVTGSQGDQVIIEIQRPFRAYSSWEESYRDWARLMQTQHYVDAGALEALKAGDPKAFGAALNRAGYASDGNYGQKVADRVASVQQMIA